jgi:hypothetical protein
MENLLNPKIERDFDVVRLQFNTNSQSMTKGRSPCTAKPGYRRVLLAVSAP